MVLCRHQARIRSRSGGWLALVGVLWLVEASLLPCFLGVLPVYVALCDEVFPFYKGTSPIGLGLTLMTSLTLVVSVKASYL